MLGIHRLLVALLVALTLLLLPSLAAAEEPPGTTMMIDVNADQAGRIRIYTLKAYSDGLPFTRDIIHLPFVSSAWDPELRIETEGAVSATYHPGNIEVIPTGSGVKLVKVWFTAEAGASTGAWGDRGYAASWPVHPAFEELGRTRLMIRVSFPPGVTPDWHRNGVRTGEGEGSPVAERHQEYWTVEKVLMPGERATMEVGYIVPSGALSQWMNSASLALSLAALVLAVWTATRQRSLGSL